MERDLLNPPTAAQDGRLHDVSIDGGPELPELEPGLELGGAVPLQPAVGALPQRALEPDVAAEGFSPSSDRIEEGVPGTHLAGTVERLDERGPAEALASERGAPAQDPEPH